MTVRNICTVYKQKTGRNTLLSALQWTGAYLQKLHHAAAGYAELSWYKADCGDELSLISLPQLHTDISQEDSIEIPAHENTRSGSRMDILAAELQTVHHSRTVNNRHTRAAIRRIQLCS